MRILILLLTASLSVFLAHTAQAFCGFYVAKADTALFNRASQVVLVRDGNRTVITMANDFEGDVQDFAMVIPVPTFIEREQINVTDKAVLEHLDAYTAPRLVEYFDADPCAKLETRLFSSAAGSRTSVQDSEQARALGVAIEASYTVGEYDILILSGTESDGLIKWLNDNGYRVPRGADKVIGSYLKQNMRFFVAKVNLAAQQQSGQTYLRPLQVAFESKKFMLPIRLGTLNAKDEQELYVYTLTRTGRVETINYRTVRLPSNTEVPEFVEDEFADFYRAMFKEQVRAQNGRAVFLEYAWDMGWCDPCAADPLSASELRKLGVFWVDAGAQNSRMAAQNVFVTRLHVRYDAEHFPEDLVFQETGDRQNYQGRYIVRHPFKGTPSCADSGYEQALRKRQEREAQQLANLTGWDIESIRARMPGLASRPAEVAEPWWKSLWN